MIVEEGYVATTKKISMKGMAFVLSKPGLYRFAGKTGRWMMRIFPFILNNEFNPWYKQREMPDPPKESFRDWYIRNKSK